jgi:heparan-sulfate lyase
MTLEKEEGQVSFGYTKKDPRPAFRYRVSKQTSTWVRFFTLVAPYSGSQPNVSFKIKGEPKIGASRIELEIVTGGISKLIRYDLSKAAK